MIISTCVKRTAPIRLRRVRGQDNDWGPATSLLAFTFSDTPRRFKTSKAGHAQVHQDHSEVCLLPCIKGIFATPRQLDVVEKLHQHLPRNFPVVVLIIDDENRHGARGIAGRAGYWPSQVMLNGHAHTFKGQSQSEPSSLADR